jgi:hypothetical protein
LNILTAICTLFEGDYHYGVGALTNSLYRSGFRGTIWAGYRGQLPFWAAPLVKKELYQVFQVADGFQICFLSLKTKHHFANYKPAFMLELWAEFCPEADKLIYFDPDIVVKREWSFFEQWMEDHVGLCEDLKSPLNPKAPKRLGWQKILEKHAVSLPFSLGLYANSGFVGLPKKHIGFLKTWKNILSIVGQEVENLEISFLPSAFGQKSSRPVSDLFYIADQDSMNCAAMIHADILAIANRDAMDFEGYGFVMSHAIGPDKPWRIKYLAQAFDGRRIRYSHKLFWSFVDFPIKLYNKYKIRWKLFMIKIASFITHFYSRT